MKWIKEKIRRLWELMLIGYRRQAYMDLYYKGLISREEMLEKTA